MRRITVLLAALLTFSASAQFVPVNPGSGSSGGGGVSLPVVDTTSIAEGSSDATKEVRLEVDGNTTGTVRVITVADANTWLPVIPVTLTITGPTAARTITFPDANWTAARTDAAQTFTGLQTFGDGVVSASVATQAGSVLALTATAPTATTGASQAGKNVNITSSNAVASTDTPGAAAGGDIVITPGLAARLTSGLASHGRVIFDVSQYNGFAPSLGGFQQRVVVRGRWDSSTDNFFRPSLVFGNQNGDTAELGFTSRSTNVINLVQGVNVAEITGSIWKFNSNYLLAWSDSNQADSTTATLVGSCGAGCFQHGDDDSATPVAQIERAQGGSGTNIAGAVYTQQAGRGTGIAAPGPYRIQTSFPTSSGTTAQTYGDRLFFGGPKTLTESSDTGIAEITIPSGAALSGTFSYTIEGGDGTETQSLRGVVQFAAVNKGGTITVTDNTTAGAPPDAAPCACTGASTLTATFSAVDSTGEVTLRLNAVSSLTQTVLRATWDILLDGGPGSINPL